jgi:hypothetical protein
MAMELRPEGVGEEDISGSSGWNASDDGLHIKPPSVCQAIWNRWMEPIP